MEILLNNLKEKISDRKTSKKMLRLEEKKIDKHLNHLEDLEEARADSQNFTDKQYNMHVSYR